LAPALRRPDCCRLPGQECNAGRKAKPVVGRLAEPGEGRRGDWEENALVGKTDFVIIVVND